jgi:hypothetical protein
MKVRIETNVECAFKGFFGFLALFDAHIEIIVNAVLKILHKIVNGLSLVGNNSLSHPYDAPVEKHIILIELNISGVPFVL